MAIVSIKEDIIIRNFGKRKYVNEEMLYLFYKEFKQEIKYLTLKEFKDTTNQIQVSFRKRELDKLIEKLNPR